MAEPDSSTSLIERLLSPEFSGGTKSFTSDQYKALQAGLLAAEKSVGVSVSNLAGMPAAELSALLGGSGEEDPWGVIAEAIRSSAAGQAATESAAAALQRELGLGQLALGQRELDLSRELGFGELGVAQQTQAAQEEQFGISQAFLEEQQAFTEKTTTTQALLEMAGLAASPTGAIQLAHLARGQGAPQAEVASIFQNLPFVQELLSGQGIPGFGLPGQLGGEMRRVPATSGTIQGQNLGVTLPGKKAITRQAFGGLTEFEQAFLGALGQSETGQGAEGFLSDIMKSFIPTRSTGALSIG
jgi:hypothetical protein